MIAIVTLSYDVCPWWVFRQSGGNYTQTYSIAADLVLEWDL